MDGNMAKHEKGTRKGNTKEGHKKGIRSQERGKRDKRNGVHLHPPQGGRWPSSVSSGCSPLPCASGFPGANLTRPFLLSWGFIFIFIPNSFSVSLILAFFRLGVTMVVRCLDFQPVSVRQDTEYGVVGPWLRSRSDNHRRGTSQIRWSWDSSSIP